MAKKSNNSVAANVANIVNARFSQEDSAVSLSISEKSKALSKASLVESERNKLLEKIDLLREKGIVNIYDTTIEAGYYARYYVFLSPDRLGGVKDANVDRLHRASRIDNEHLSSRLCLKALAEEYAKIQEEFKSMYNDGELGSQLSQLAADYKRVLKEIACRVSSTIESYPNESGGRGRELRMARDWLDKNPSLGFDSELFNLNEMLEKIGLEEYKPTTGSVGNISDFIRNLIMQMGEAAKQSIIENSAQFNEK